MRQIDFISKRNKWFAVSAVLLAISLIFLLMPGRGLKLGIDFTGGQLLDLRFSKAVTTAEVREALVPVGLQDAQIQKTGSGNEVLVRTPSLTPDKVKQLNGALEARLGKFETLRNEEVKGVIGNELAKKGALALVIANIGMVIYVTVRFEYKFALTAIAALVHDVIILLGFYAVTGLEANSTLIAAVLTIVGYSINDTIVIFDRIRENLGKRKREPLSEVVNKSVNQTMTRSLNTSLTTLLAISAVYLFGGATTKDFALSLLIGVTAGTYSSIFVASPLWYLWKMKEEADGVSVAQIEGAAAQAAAATSAKVSPKGKKSR